MIDVSSVQVPSLFQDNFDYGDIRRDFVHGVLTSDLLMKNIYCYIAKEGYAARVKDTRSYDSIRLVPQTTPLFHTAQQIPAKTYFQDGHSLWCRMITILVVTHMNTYGETNTSQRTTLWYSLGRDIFLTRRITYPLLETSGRARSETTRSLVQNRR